MQLYQEFTCNYKLSQHATAEKNFAGQLTAVFRMFSLGFRQFTANFSQIAEKILNSFDELNNQSLLPS